MLDARTTIQWGSALLWLGGMAGGSFLISWFLTDVLHARRAAYVAWLTLLTGGLTFGYLAWSGAGAAFWVDRWVWGILGAGLAGTFLALMVSRVPTRRSTGRMSGIGALWDGVVYGSAEGLLLSVLPVVITWQLLGSLGWTTGWRGAAAVPAALAASVIVIVVHHLGYRAYRGREIVSPVVGCTVLSLAYLVTASPIAAVGGHIILHLVMKRRGMELPPHADAGVAEMEQELTRPQGTLVGGVARLRGGAR